jgi:hypothetical protein
MCHFYYLIEKNKMQTILFMGGGGANTYIKNVFYSDSKWYLVKMQEKLLKHAPYRLTN